MHNSFVLSFVKRAPFARYYDGLKRMPSNKKYAKSSKKEAEPDSLESYINYYKSIDLPGFAVLVTGAWGSGKTFQVQNIIASEERYYVSLFGLTSKEDVYGELLGQIYPSDVKARKEASFIEKINPAGIPIGIVMAGIIRKSLKSKIQGNRIVVFDDVERCDIPLKVLLGLINDLVEHEKCHVLVIAHDTKITGEFSGAKEKVFGHTIAVRPKTSDAFDFFTSELKSSTQEVLIAQREALMELFLLSGCQSLRVLRQALMGLERFCELLEKNQLADIAIVTRLLSLYFAISVEVLRGEIGRVELVDRVKSYTELNSILDKSNGDEALTTNSFGTSRTRYKGLLDIVNYDLSDALLVRMIVDGQYSKTELQNYFTENQIFDAEAKWPAWRRFMDLDSQTDEVVEAAAREMDKQFDNREIEDLGELMHIVSLRIMRVKYGLLACSRSNVIEDCLKYLDDLVEQKRFPLKPDFDIFDPHPVYGGVMFWGYEENVDVFITIHDHVLACKKKSLELSSSDIKRQILSAIEMSPAEIGKLLNFSDDEGAEYQTVPVLLYVPPTDFVDAFLKLPVEHWRGVQRVLSKRLEMSSSYNSLAGEKNWFDELEKEMIKKSDAEGGTLTGLRIKRHIPRRR